MFTRKELKNSQEYKEWVKGKVALIHNCYYDSEENCAAYIVIHSDSDKWTITRFFKLGNKIQVSVDHSDIPTEKVFGILLIQYSRGLK